MCIGSKSLLWLAGPSAAGAARELRGILCSFLLWWCLARPQHTSFHFSVFSLATLRRFQSHSRHSVSSSGWFQLWERTSNLLWAVGNPLPNVCVKHSWFTYSSAQLQPLTILTVSGFSCCPYRHTHLHQRSTLGPCLTLCIKIPATYHNKKKNCVYLMKTRVPEDCVPGTLLHLAAGLLLSVAAASPPPQALTHLLLDCI